MGFLATTFLQSGQDAYLGNNVAEQRLQSRLHLQSGLSDCLAVLFVETLVPVDIVVGVNDGHLNVGGKVADGANVSLGTKRLDGFVKLGHPRTDLLEVLDDSRCIMTERSVDRSSVNHADEEGEKNSKKGKDLHLDGGGTRFAERIEPWIDVRGVLVWRIKERLVESTYLEKTCAVK